MNPYMKVIVGMFIFVGASGLVALGLWWLHNATKGRDK